MSHARLLFQRFPSLAEKLPWMQLADLPTPVQRLPHLGEHLGMSNLWIKRDDLDSNIYSGNKPRKFEFIFADAKRKGCQGILTIGSAGSNHGAATTLFCCHEGLQPTLALVPQPVLSYVRQNIFINYCRQAQFMHAPNDALNVLNVMRFYLTKKIKGEPAPYFMYFGGSSVLGNIGFVEAGLELAEQIKRGEMPLPKHLFVTTGSCGTHAGLLVGLKLAQLPIQVIGVRIVPKIVTNRHVVALHANRTAAFLHRLEPSFPRLHFNAAEINLIENFYGGQYGRPTEEGKAAIRLFRETENQALDPTYTAKTFAAMLDFIKRRRLTGEPVLYWQTLNTVDLSAHTAGRSPEELPPPLRHYFTEPLYDPDL